jgi:polycomb protein EED
MIHLSCLLILQVTTYRCLENGSFAVLQAYVDEDVRKTMPDVCVCESKFDNVLSLMLMLPILSQKDESFYTLSWARDHVDGSPLLVAAGSNGIIRVINCATEKLAKVYYP